MANHIWKFSITGGVSQARIESAEDLLALAGLDKKLWVALSCPTKGIEFDTRTLYLIDTDRDGHIRPPEIIAAIGWATSMLKSPDIMVSSPAAMPLSAINESTDDGRAVLGAARSALARLGKTSATEITLDDIAEVEALFADSKFNGDGIVPAGASDDGGLNSALADIVACTGGEQDRSGVAGVSQAKLDGFFRAASAYDAWYSESEQTPGILPYGPDTPAMADAVSSVRSKIDDFFTRCALAEFDASASGSLNPAPESYLPLTHKDLSAGSSELSALPVSRITAGCSLNLTGSLNPAWATRMAAFRDTVVARAIGPSGSLDLSQWIALKEKFAAHELWLGRKEGLEVEKLGILRVREMLRGGYKAGIEALIAKDLSHEDEIRGLLMVEKLIRYCRDLFMLVNNFVSFRDFYSRQKPAIFQAGTLYIDSRSCELCIKVEDPHKHAALASMGRLCLVYCECTRKDERMAIVAALTAGDSDHITEGRNGVFYDRRCRDWKATVVKVIEHPISMRQAFWAPYKRVGRMVGEQIQKISAARSKSIEAQAASSIVGTGEKAASKTPPPPPPQPFDVGKFAGIFAAIGLAVGAIGTAIAAVVTGLFRLSWWQLPLAMAGLALAVSGPSMLIAWFKLSQRNLAPLLDANGWAVNSRVSINLPFGMTLTSRAKLPEGAERSLIDPFAEKKRPMLPALLVMLALSVIAAVVYYRFIA